MVPEESPAPPPIDPRAAVRRVGLIVVIGMVLTLAVGAALWRAFADARQNAAVVLRPEWVLLGGLLWTAALPLQALRWRALLPGVSVPAGPLAWIVVGANLLNLALPGPGGELVAAWVVHRRWGVPLLAAAVSSVLARLLALVVLGVLVLVGWPLVAPSTPVRWLEAGAVGAGIASASLAISWLRPDLVEAGIRAAGGLLPVGIRARLAEHSAWWGDGLGSIGRLGPRRWLVAAGWSAANALVLGVATWVAFGATGHPPPLLALLYTHLLASLAVVSAMLLPGGVGAVDAVYLTVLPTLSDIGPIQAAFGALALRQAQLVSMVLSVPALLGLLRSLRR